MPFAVKLPFLMNFPQDPIKASLIQLMPDASKQAVEMFALIMKYNLQAKFYCKPVCGTWHANLFV